MPLWLPELLDDPGLGLEVVAGHAGVTERGPVRWAHIADAPDPTPWLEGGEVLLTTGLGVKDDPELQRRLVAALDRRGVVGVGFGIGVVLDAVPTAMADACDEHALPLFTVPYEVPFIAVTRRVSHHTFAEHDATLRSAVALHRQVLAAVVAEQGIDGVLATVGPAMPAASLVAFDYSGRELGRHDPDGTVADLGVEKLWVTAVVDGSRTVVELDDHLVISRPVRLGDEIEAVVVAVSRHPLVEHEELLFEQGIAGVSLELARNRSVREANRTRVDELLEEVHSGRATSASTVRAIDRLGVDVRAGYRVLAVACPTGATSAHLCSVVEDAVRSSGRPLVGRLNGTVLAIVPDDAGAADAVAAAAVARGWTGVRVGRSRAKRDLEALAAALREARVALALDVPEAVRDVDQLGLPGLLAGMRDDLGTSDFVAGILGPVLVQEGPDETPLLDSLRAYLAHGCRPGPAAEELCVHRHTLAYRLDRIRDLTGRDPRSGEHLLDFGLALELHDGEADRT
ncbi:MAG: PucR family transcriptional regulator [Nitriliruptor sp.]|uniref:PucR family transcriptional regulator n=1 Tax=Nitriliruptor sp. TaxID=2448056 RepID=UPI0034A0362C